MNPKLISVSAKASTPPPRFRARELGHRSLFVPKAVCYHAPKLFVGSGCQKDGLLRYHLAAMKDCVTFTNRHIDTSSTNCHINICPANRHIDSNSLANTHAIQHRGCEHHQYLL